MIRAALIALALLALPAAAQQPPRPRPPSLGQGGVGGGEAAAPGPAVPNTGIARGTGALLRTLDKISGRTTDISLRLGESATLGRLEVRLGECRYPAGDPSSDAFAQMTITDTGRGATVFAGWMIASSPALSALDDARYDVWVISCSSD